MSKAQHTPTPWKVFIEDYSVVIMSKEGDHVCDCNSSYEEDGENKANAELIVKAVNCHDELLAAFKEILELMPMRAGKVSYGMPAFIKYMEAVQKISESAINKAKPS